MSATKHIRVPYGLSVHGREEIQAVTEVLRGNTAVGKRTEEFERRIARMFGKKYGIMVNSGSSANLLSLEILDLPKGSEVITPLLTFSTTVAPIVQKGLVPVFIDVKLNEFVIDTSQVEKAISQKTRALFIPSLLGNIPDMQKLAAIAKRHKLWLIEDSCDTLGGRFADRPTGRYSHITTTSFYGSHIINGAGGGGMICVNNPHWAKRLIVLRGWGRESSLFGEGRRSERIENRFRRRLSGIPYDNKFIFSEAGYNFLPLEISSAFGLVQLRKFSQFARIRRRNFRRLLRFFQKCEKFFILPRQTPHTSTTWLAFPLLLKKSAPFSRFEIVKHLEQNDIQTRPIFTGNILKQPGFRRIPKRLLRQGYPNAEYIMRRGFVVGCHQGLGEAHLRKLERTFADFLKKFYSK